MWDRWFLLLRLESLTTKHPSETTFLNPSVSKSTSAPQAGVQGHPSASSATWQSYSKCTFIEELPLSGMEALKRFGLVFPIQSTISQMNSSMKQYLWIPSACLAWKRCGLKLREHSHVIIFKPWTRSQTFTPGQDNLHDTCLLRVPWPKNMGW